MGLIINLGILGMALVFLVGVLSSLPMPGSTPTEGQTEASDESFSVELVQKVAGLFSGSYTSIVDDIASFQEDPDLERAKSRREEMLEYGKSVTGDYKDFSEEMEKKFEDLDLESALEEYQADK